MAYMSKEHKEKIAKAMKECFPGSSKDHGFKYTLSVHHYSSIVCTISEGTVDFFGALRKKEDYKYAVSEAYMQVNEYNIPKTFSGPAAEILIKIAAILNIDNHNRSDAMTDFFDIGHFVHINIGKWNKPYRLIEAKK